MELRSAFPTAVGLGALLGAAIAIVSPIQSRNDSAIAVGAVAALVDVPAQWDIPVVWNSSVHRFVALFRDKQPDRMALYLKRSGRYEGMIRSKLRERGMPEDLVYLSMIESGFLPSARSRVGAVGLWQLMPDLARSYGLRVDGYVDERRDPEKSTDVALRHLQYLHEQFGSWNLAAAAYNGGENRVARLMRAQTGSKRGEDADFWRIRRHLPEETREYVPLIYAAALIGKEPQKYGLEDVERWLPVSTDTVAVGGGVDLEVVGRALGLEEKDVRRLNPQLVQGVTPPGKPYAVRIPDGRAAQFAVEFPRVQAEARAEATRLAELERQRVRARKVESARKAKLARRNHKVRKGETLTSIARKHGVSIQALQKANGLRRRSLLQPGQTLRVPSAE